jgi:hypothetical protein
METLDLIQKLIFLAGLSQIVLVIGSLAIPMILNWRLELAKVQPLIKQMFWTYAGYILVINLCFAVISVCDFKDLTNRSNLAVLINGFIAAYWISRVLIQFFYFDRENFRKGHWHKVGEVVLVTLFILLSAVYTGAFIFNYTYLNGN